MARGIFGEYGVFSAFLFELLATFLFVTVILGATRSKGWGGGLRRSRHWPDAGPPFTWLEINITGVSVNPARSFGPALFAGAGALADLWLFFVAPLLGAALAGWLEVSGLTGGEDN